MSTKLRLIKFGGEWCAACKHMDRQRVLEQFAAVTPNVLVLRHEVDQDAEDLIADAYDVNAMPTLLFEDAISGAEHARFEGGMSLRDLRSMYEAALRSVAGDKLPKELSKYRSKVKTPRAGGYDGVKTGAEKAVAEAPEPEPEPEPEPGATPDEPNDE